MGKYLNVGNAGFQSMRKGQYIDKTGMIRFINQTLGTMEKLTCVSRPRRFGKSFAAKMLCAYYDRSCDSKALFAGCRIAEDAGFEEHLDRYDVLYLDITLFIAGAADIRKVVKDISKKVIGEIRQIYPEVRKEDTLFDTLSSVVQVTGNKFMLLFTGGIFLSGYAGQEASGVRPMWKTGQKQSYKPA